MQVTNAIMLPIGVILVAIFVVQSQGALGFGTMQGIGGGVYRESRRWGDPLGCDCCPYSRV